MKTTFSLFILFCMTTLFVFSSSQSEEPLTIKGFFIGMTKTQVQEVYKKLLADTIASNISIESEEDLDIITIDNELSSMGNKIEISYDEDSAKVSRLNFQYKTVDILFNAEELGAEELILILKKEYGLPKMELKDMGFVKTWTCIVEEQNIKISVDNNKNLRIHAYK